MQLNKTSEIMHKKLATIYQISLPRDLLDQINEYLFYDVNHNYREKHYQHIQQYVTNLIWMTQISYEIVCSIDYHNENDEYTIEYLNCYHNYYSYNGHDNENKIIENIQKQMNVEEDSLDMDSLDLMLSYDDIKSQEYMDVNGGIRYKMWFYYDGDDYHKRNRDNGHTTPNQSLDIDTCFCYYCGNYKKQHYNRTRIYNEKIICKCIQKN